MMKRLRKLGRYLIACGLTCALLACASAVPPPSAKKVQTVEELLTKLKKAFDTGTITDPDFYARELGYPLVGPLTYSPDTVFDTKRDQYIALNEGQFKGTLLLIRTGSSPEGKKFITVSTNTGHIGCFSFQNLLDVWGSANLKQVPDHAISHRHGATNPPIFYASNKLVNGATLSAHFDIGSKDYCLGSFSVSEILK